MADLTTTNFKVKSAERFVASFQAEEFSLYLTAHKNTNPNTLLAKNDDVYDTVVDAYQTMMFGKRIHDVDVSLMIPRYDYTYGKIYAKYNHLDPLLFNKEFYVVTHEGAFYHLFKVLDNYNDSPSTIQPSVYDTNYNDNFYQTSDGYVWKFMYTVSETDVDKFGTIYWFPVVSNTSVSNSAVDGAIDVVSIENSGEGYQNYLTGTFSTTDIQLAGNNLFYKIGANSSVTTDFYKGCLLYITSDPLGNSAGDYAKVAAYTINATAKYLELETPLTNVPVNGATFQLYPSVDVIGDGFQTKNVFAWAVINATTNSIHEIQVLEKGAGYRAATAYVNAHASVGVSINANVAPILSPSCGHGYSPLTELGAKAFCVSASFANTESNTIFANTEYNQISLISDPIFNNVVVKFSTANGNFSIGQNVTLWSSEIYIENTNAFALGYINNGIPLPANANPDSTLINHIGSAVVSDITSNTLTLDSLTFPIANGDVVIANNGAYCFVNDILRSGISKGFDTLIQAHQYTGYVYSGVLANNEVLTQSSTNSYAILSAFENANTLYATGQFNQFTAPGNVVGNTSGAIFVLNSKIDPELEFGKGEILYISTFDDVQRSTLRTERFKIIVKPTGE